MTVIEAPTRTRGRGEATVLLQRLDDDLEGHEISVVFEARALATTSFIDELVRIILYTRHASSFTAVGLPPHLGLVARQAAEHYGVAQRLRVVDSLG